MSEEAAKAKQQLKGIRKTEVVILRTEAMAA